MSFNLQLYKPVRYCPVCVGKGIWYTAEVDRRFEDFIKPTNLNLQPVPVRSTRRECPACRGRGFRQ